MKELILSAPTLGFIVGTRIALAVGIGLLVSQRMPESRRRAIGSALVAFGALTTIPAIRAIGRARRSNRRMPPAVSRDSGLIGATRFPRKGDENEE